jgi:hypothetical protein
MYKHIVDIISSLDTKEIAAERKEVLVPLKEFVKTRLSTSGEVALLFICTHNSRRSHLAQVWAHVMAHFYGHHGISTYSGGTEATAVFSQTLETLIAQGFGGGVKGFSGSTALVTSVNTRNAGIDFQRDLDNASNALTSGNIQSDIYGVAGETAYRGGLLNAGTKLLAGGYELSKVYKDK